MSKGGKEGREGHEQRTNETRDKGTSYACKPVDTNSNEPSWLSHYLQISVDHMLLMTVLYCRHNLKVGSN